MRGTTTAGDTAPSTAPMIAASITDTPSSHGASSTTPAVSHSAGRNDISTAGRPTRRKSATSSASPARIRITISAISRSAVEISSSDWSSKLHTNGPTRMPAANMPTIRGRPMRAHATANSSPAKNTTASDANMFYRLLPSVPFPLLP